ncbi:DUF1513 domain-containing protein [Photobacterium sanguinicancri]|uniref:DUF1513 domain-containing protein n=1 Tax=Photobacterium sanguinicancri TaxID=875932 RepID=UPI00078722ED|nr:DUF1513 domain-containing protein [Photobacterium sanguinicancri]KXI23907.1 hypothetical protein AS132_05850 [Photobacterium sanguinicancri]
MVTDLTRRKLLKMTLTSASVVSASTMSGCSMLLPLGGDQQIMQVSGKPAIIGCSRRLSGGYAAVVADTSGTPLYQFPLPARGHGIAVQKNGAWAAAFGRRPGQYMQVFNYQTGEQLPLVVAKPDRYFYGHGVFSPDGQYLYATEGERGTSRGIIGVYRITTETINARVEKVSELTGFGIGPHEVVLADVNTLAIGVGGVHTQGRTPVNLASMQPALVYLDIATGKVDEQAVLADKQLSIRHLSVTESGDVVCGQQYRGEPDHAAPLVAVHQRGKALQHLHAEEEDWLRFNHYIASIASLDGYILATSPRGNCYGVWRESDRQLIDIKPLIDASGVGVINNNWVVGSGSGKMLTVSQHGQLVTNISPVLWDNHWSVLD